MALGLAGVYLLLLIPEPAAVPPAGAGRQPFRWSQPHFWAALQADFLRARSAPSAELGHDIARLQDSSRSLLASPGPLGPLDPVWVQLETNLFTLAALVAADPRRLPDFAALSNLLRRRAKDASAGWDMSSGSARERLYRLLYGSRLALEEVLVQNPEAAAAIPAECEPEPSQTPAVTFRGVTLHSGDLLVSRGDAPTSALISRGNDLPGAFSHVSLLHVDAERGSASVIQALIEKGVVVTPLEAYARDRRLRLVVLRPRADLPALRADSQLPAKAAAAALASATVRHIPYDFAMNYLQHDAMFCSEVASAAYDQHGLRLWMGMSHISSPTLMAWLGSLGVRHFETQEPADLEYDPQLRVVAEWREVPALWQAHLDDAVTDAMLEQAPPGRPLPFNPLALPPARVLKAYSALLNRLHSRGTIPEGMSATVALRADRYKARHKAIKARLVPLAEAFRQANGFSPPYWELVRLAAEASK